MNAVCLDEASCPTASLSVGSVVADRAAMDAAMTDVPPSWEDEKPPMRESSATELARRLSEVALRCRAPGCTQDDLASLENLTQRATAHVRTHGINTVDHIVLSGALKVIVRDIPAVADILQQARWQWFGR